MSTSSTRSALACVGESPAVCTSVRSVPSEPAVAASAPTDARSDTSTACAGDGEAVGGRARSTTAPSFASSKSASTRCAPPPSRRAHATPIPPTPVTTTTRPWFPLVDALRDPTTPAARGVRSSPVGSADGQFPSFLVPGRARRRVSRSPPSVVVAPASGAATIDGRRQRSSARSTPSSSAPTARPGSPSSCSAVPTRRMLTAGVGDVATEDAVRRRPTPCDSPAWPRRSAARRRCRRSPTASSTLDATVGADPARSSRPTWAKVTVGAAAPAHERRPRLQPEPRVPGGGRWHRSTTPPPPEQLLTYVAERPAEVHPRAPSTSTRTPTTSWSG